MRLSSGGPNDCRNLACRRRSGASRMAFAIMDHTADGIVDRAYLQLSHRFGERRADRCGPRLYSDAVGAGPLAGAGAYRFDAGPTAQFLARGSDPLHSVARGDLERGSQRPVFTPPKPGAAVAVRDLPAGDHRHANLVEFKADGASARCNAGELADSTSALPSIRRCVS